MSTTAMDLESRARLSRGASSDAIHALVETLVTERHDGGGLLVDVGCGTGALCRRLRPHFAGCTGIDAVRYEGLDSTVDFVRHDLDRPGIPLADGCADVVTAVETIEHLENPWAFTRELARLTTAGGWVIITTPNQLSLLSKWTVVVKNAFNAFQAPSYPAHRTALLEVDLRRAAAEAGLVDAHVRYSGEGRIPFSARHYPRLLSRLLPRACSDNVAIMARKPDARR